MDFCVNANPLWPGLEVVLYIRFRGAERQAEKLDTLLEEKHKLKGEVQRFMQAFDSSF